MINEIIESLADIHNEFEKHYRSSFDSEEQFLEIVKLDPSSFPKQGNDYDMTTEPERVGQLASGNGLFIRCWNNGERDFLNYKDDVIRASLEFLRNRKSFAIKNPGAFPSVRDFVDYVLNKKELQVDQTAVKPKNKNVSIDDKFETYYAKDFNRSDFDKIIIIDPQTEVRSDKIGDVAQQVLLRLNANADLSWLDDQEFIYRLKKFCQFYYSRLVNLSVKNLNQYTSWDQFTKDLDDNIPSVKIQNARNSWSVQLFKNKEPNITEGQHYEIVGVTNEYTIFRFLNYKASHQLDWPNIERYIGTDEGPNNRTLNWCTGYGSSYFTSYGDPSRYTMLSFAPNNPDYRMNKYEYMQISLTNNQTSGGVRGALNGDDGTSGSSWLRAGRELRQNSELLRQSFNVNNWGDGEIFMFDFFMKYPSVLPYVNKYPTFENHRVVRAAMACTQPEQRAGGLAMAPQEYTYTDSIEFSKWKGQHSIQEISELTIGDNVTQIPDYEFEGAVNLLKINWSSSTNLKSIGIRSFAKCTSLTKLEIPEGVEVLGIGAFSDCANLSGSIRLPLSIRRIYPYAFKNHNKKGVRFTLPDTFVAQHNKLIVPNINDKLSSEQEANWWRAENRFTFRNN